MNIIHSDDLQRDLAAQVAALPHDRLYVLADETTATACWPVISGYDCMQGAQLITIPPTDEAKTTESLAHVWTELGRLGGSRRSLLINLGGGMVTDLGGFAAATFKRGIRFVNIPTTLLAMVDASVGGKTGINLGGLKNEVGVFRDADSVIISTVWLRTLDDENLRSGYAEMLKHGIISTPQHLAALLRCDITRGGTSDALLSALCSLLPDSVSVKQRIVTDDPQEHGIRKALNLGHTTGHAIESLAMRRGRTVLHGYAVAWGLVCELYLSCVRCGFPAATMRQVVRYIRETYGACPVTCDDYDEIVELMTHDKKNHDGQIICTLMSDVGQIEIDQRITRDDITAMLDFLREGA